MALIDDLKKPKRALSEFKDITIRVLNYSVDVISDSTIFNGYKLSSSYIAGTEKKIRPLNNDLFIFMANEFNKKYLEFIDVLKRIKIGERSFPQESYKVIDRILYTMQQAMGIGFDLLGESNSARKHVGNRFEELIRLIITEVGISNKRVILNIPYLSEKAKKNYRCEIDIVISKYPAVKSTNKFINSDEVIISLKTTTKDRIGKIFIDKILIEKFMNEKVKVVGISLNDVQRKSDGKNNQQKISYTFVSNLFMVYTRFLTKLNGYYYLDIPKSAKSPPFSDYIFQFSRFLVEDIWKLL